MVQTRWNPVLVMTVEFPSETYFGVNVYTWCGWSDSVVVLGSPSPGSGNIAAFLQSSSQMYPTHWYCVVNSNTASATYIDSGVVIAANTRYKLKIDCLNPASIGFWINGRLVATAAANLPGVSVPLGLIIATVTADSNDKYLNISSAECRVSA